jgi:hypothetical protein
MVAKASKRRVGSSKEKRDARIGGTVYYIRVLAGSKRPSTVSFESSNVILYGMRSAAVMGTKSGETVQRCEVKILRGTPDARSSQE